MSLYRNNWHIFCCSHVVFVALFGACGMQFIVPQLYSRKCYSPLAFVLNATFFVFLVQSYMIEIISKKLRSLLTICFVVYYLLLFLHMYCFLSEAFSPEPVWKEALERKRKKKDSLLIV